MLLSHFGIEAGQDEIIAAAKLSQQKLKVYGMTVVEMAEAVKVVAPQMALWYKTDSSISQLREIVGRYDYPVGINWQGIFEDGAGGDYEDEGGDEDEGHFSVVIDVDTQENFIRIADPYGRFAGNDRLFPIVEFEKRWWDEDWEEMVGSKKKRYVYYNKMMFVIVPSLVTFPMEMGMRRL